MKLSTRRDIEAPSDVVWSILSDFDHWERAALRRGIEVHRSQPETPAAAMPLAWKATVVWRDKPRPVSLRVISQDPGQRLVMGGGGETVGGQMSVDLLEMAPRRTRIIVGVEVKPLTLGARLFLQSLKLMRGKLEDRLAARVETFATLVESRAGGRSALAMRGR